MENIILKMIAVTTGIVGMGMCYLIGYVHAKIESKQDQLARMTRDLDKVN